MKMHRLLWVIAPLVFWTSCQSLYLPSGPNVPLMSEGDEFQVGMSLGSNGYGAQLAYSPYYHWAITANGSAFSINSGGSFSTNVVFRHLYGEMGTGLYTRLSKYVRLEGLGGYGVGYTGDPIDDKSLYRKFYFQPSLGYSSPILDLGITPRLCWVTNYAHKDHDVVTKVNDHGTFLEPTITARLGYEQLKFQAQGGLAFALGDAPFSYRKSFLVVGFHLTFVKDFDKYK